MKENERAVGAGVFWAWLPAMLLGSMLVGLGTLAYIAIDDPSFALEPNYYDKAVHWDQSQAQQRQSQALGFELKLGQPLVVSRDGRTFVELELKDRAGVDISGANLAVSAFPNAFASRIEELVLREEAPGIYRGELKHAVPGLWELRCSVNVGSAHYTSTLRADVAKRGAA